MKGWITPYLFQLFDCFILLLDVVHRIFDFAVGPHSTEDLFTLEFGCSLGVFGQLVQLFFTCIGYVRFQLPLDPGLNRILELSLDRL